MSGVMRAVELPEVGAPLQLVERPIPEPGPGEVRVRVQACGVCGSDLLVQKGAFGAQFIPLIPGHEAAGIVDAVGPEVDSLQEGDLVALWYVDAPPSSPYSMRGRANIAPEGRRMGMHVNGAMAEYVVRPARTCIVPSKPIDPVDLAVLTDAVATPYHAYVRIAHLEEGENVAVLGIGGVGSNAVQLAKHFGARVVAVSRSQGKLDLASRFGADEVVPATDDSWPDRVRQAFAPYGPDVVMQCAASAELDQAAVRLAAPGGRVVFIGTATDPFQNTGIDMVFRELALLGSRGFTAEDIQAVVELFIDGTIATDHLTEQRRPLEEANEALEDRRGGVGLRTVLIP